MTFSIAMTYIAIQFWFLTKDIYVNNIIALTLAISSFVSVSLILPESPRFLYSRHEFAKAREVVKKVARMNGKQKEIGEDFYFKAELAEEESMFYSEQNKAEEVVMSTEVNVMQLKGSLRELFSIRVYR